MDGDMLHLAERLVIAMETMSLDVKKMSAYVYDISCGVSHLVKEKRGKESNPFVAHAQSKNPSSGTSSAAQTASAEGNYSEQYQQADESSSSHISAPEQGKSSFGDIASMSISPHEESGFLASDSNSHFSEQIKAEEPSEDEENAESYDMHNMYGNSQNMVTFWDELKSEQQSETDDQDEAYGMHTRNSNPPEEMTPSNSLETIEHASTYILRNNQHIKTSNNSAVNSHDRTQEKLPGTLQMKNAENALVVHARVDSEERHNKSSVCEKSFKSGFELVRHTHIHSGERQYKCNVCGKGFSRKANVEIHMRTHTGERPFECNICGKAFSERGTLTAHLRIHTGEKPFTCMLCGKVFSRKTNLRVHIQSHTGEKPCSCNVCGKGVLDNTKLEIHMRTHTGEKPYSCDVCGRAFSQSSSLKRHMGTHTGDKPHKCSSCGKAFSQARMLRIHMQTHTSKKTYTCAFVEKDFSRKNQRAHSHTPQRNHFRDSEYTYFVLAVPSE